VSVVDPTATIEPSTSHVPFIARAVASLLPPILWIEPSKRTQAKSHLLGLERPIQFEHVALKPVLPLRRGHFHCVPKLRVPRCPQVDRRPRGPDAASECRDAQPGVGNLIN